MTRARRAWRLLWLGTTATLLLSPSPAAAAAARTITLSGPGAAHPLAAELAYFYRRDTARAPRFSLLGGGTATGIADTARGVVDAALTDRPLGPGDPPGLRYTPLARSALCLVANPDNPVASVTAVEGIEWAGSSAAVAYEGLPCSPAAPYPARRELGVVTRGTPRGALGRFLRRLARDATAKRVIASRYVLP
jgi:hypothetical protein